MCFTYDEYCEVYNQSIRKCRKPHKCEECRAVIEVGSLCLYVSGIFEREPFDYRVCGACQLTRWRIRIHELAEGCRGSETWCPIGELAEACEYGEIERTRDQQEGQAYFRFEKERIKANAAVCETI